MHDVPALEVNDEADFKALWDLLRSEWSIEWREESQEAIREKEKWIRDVQETFFYEEDDYQADMEIPGLIRLLHGLHVPSEGSSKTNDLRQLVNIRNKKQHIIILADLWEVLGSIRPSIRKTCLTDTDDEYAEAIYRELQRKMWYWRHAVITYGSHIPVYEIIMRDDAGNTLDGKTEFQRAYLNRRVILDIVGNERQSYSETLDRIKSFYSSWLRTFLLEVERRECGDFCRVFEDLKTLKGKKP
ncbi:hypothetical protein FPQ18DRAFT_301433 [Pyronema domesticum]|nr:hypothetical protein FPQ18DRAFT_301433 [Pyronema domesticum]